MGFSASIPGEGDIFGQCNGIGDKPALRGIDSILNSSGIACLESKRLGDLTCVKRAPKLTGRLFSFIWIYGQQTVVRLWPSVADRISIIVIINIMLFHVQQQTFY